MAKFSRGKYAQFISDRSGMAFPYLEMVKEWTGARVHISEYEPKQPQVDPRPHGADAQALQHARPRSPSVPTASPLDNVPFSTTNTSTTLRVYQQDNERQTGDAVRFTQVKEAVGGVPITALELDTTLNGDVTANATTITLTDATYFPTSGYFVIQSVNADTGLYDSETIKYTGKAGNDLTGCTRGTASPTRGNTPSSTTAAAHSSGDKVYGSYIITRVTETVPYPGEPSTRTVSNYFTLALVNAATSTATGGGAFVFGGPPNQTNQYPR